LAESIEKLELGNKNLQMLEGLGVSRIGDLAQYTDLDLFKAPLSGQTIVQELSTALGAFGVSLPKPDIKA
jgi:DNA-directed RNA polymerase alpha subunit